jgi:serine protease Do
MQKKPTFAVKFLLFSLFFLGIGLTIFIILDAEVLHYWARPPGSQPVVKPEPAKESNGSKEIDQLRMSITLVESRNCDDPTKGSTGTGFVVMAEGNTRYIATNAHVVQNSANCDGLSIFDSSGDRHRAELAGISISKGLSNDLAVIKVENIDTDKLPPLELLNSENYKNGHDGEQIITVGYPVPGLASTYDKASVSGPGLISQFDDTKGYFIASSLSLNKGNSGGPVFLVKGYKVLGIAVAKVNKDVAENVAMVIPINRFKDFCKDKTGKALK